MGKWCVLARLQGTLIDAPSDGVQRRFTSFFAKIALQLDSQAFPDVQAVEVRADRSFWSEWQLAWGLSVYVFCGRRDGEFHDPAGHAVFRSRPADSETNPREEA